MAFKMKGFPKVRTARMTESAGGLEDKKGIDQENYDNYESFIIRKHPQFENIPDPKDILGYHGALIVDFSHSAYDPIKEQFPYNPDVNYDKATWSGE